MDLNVPSTAQGHLRTIVYHIIIIRLYCNCGVSEEGTMETRGTTAGKLNKSVNTLVKKGYILTAESAKKAPCK